MRAARQRVISEPFPPQPPKGIFFTMETKKYTKKELTDAVVLLMQLYEIKLQEAVYDLDNDDEQLNKSLKKLMLFNMNLGKETYLESAMIFVQNQLNDLQNV